MKNNSNKIGFIAGSFDLIHPGYINAFKDSKEHCDFLVVALHHDPSSERSQKIKPILSPNERKQILQSIKFIDAITEYRTEKELIDILRKIQPDIRFLGDDYKDKEYTGKGIVKDVIFLDRSHGWSTTKFKKLVYENYKTWSKE
jgi:glycerol-3-phosphate cytidylyltransferase